MEEQQQQIIQHFSHYHPLSLSSNVINDDVLCYACNKPISATTNTNTSAAAAAAYYSCAQEEGGCKDNIYLHKSCAELPEALQHPFHQPHPLTLYSRPHYPGGKCVCNVCGVDEWRWFVYQCLKCEFDMCLTCVFLDRNLVHEGHHHPLTLLPTQALFTCHACNAEEKDMSYLCYTCQFWIHKTCAAASTTLFSKRHDQNDDHPLKLAYSLPQDFRTFKQYCAVCRKIVHQSYWLYYCGNCRFFSHLKCALSTQDSESGESDDELDGEESLSLPIFPLSDQFSTEVVIQNFIKGIVTSLGANNEDKTDDADDNPSSCQFYHVDNNGNEHPLALVNNNNGMKNDDDTLILLCERCVQPIISTSPYYACAQPLQCNFLVHISCLHLPLKIQHPLHPQHSLALRKPPSSYYLYYCDFCRTYTNGYVFKCESYHYFVICIVCASLPTKLKHQLHKHPLTQLKFSHKKTRDWGYCSGYGYGCESCGFYLSRRSAILPATIKHRWDSDHPLELMHPPVKNHPHDSDCELCSKDIDPNYWFYHCPPCDLSFHIKCLSGFSLYSSNVKYGATVKLDDDKYHQHSLTFTQNKSKRAPCSTCGTGNRMIGQPILECCSCKFVVSSRCRNDLD